MAVSSALLSLHLSPTPERGRGRRKAPPISISTNPSHVDPLHLQSLLFASNHSCHRFPVLGPDGQVEPVDLAKLRIALAHSFVVVSVFCRPKFLGAHQAEGFVFEDLFERMGSKPDSDQRLVGFGRAVSDGGSTASIHDVVCFSGHAIITETGYWSENCWKNRKIVLQSLWIWK